MSVDEFLASLGLGHKAQVFKDNEIDDLETLCLLEKEDLREMVSLGATVKILKALSLLPPDSQSSGSNPASPTAPTPPATLSQTPTDPQVSRFALPVPARGAATWQYENPGRKPMVGFNAGTAQDDAVHLTNFLCQNGFPTFCTGVKYGGGYAGGQDWQIDTNRGVNECSAFIPLMTGELGKDKLGWQKSGETQQEFQIVFKRWKKSHHKHPLIIPVMYASFDDTYDSTSGHLWKQNLNTCQMILRCGDTWMQQVLAALVNQAEEAFERLRQQIYNLAHDPEASSADVLTAQKHIKSELQSMASLWPEDREKTRMRNEMLRELNLAVWKRCMAPPTCVPPENVHHWLFLGNTGVGKSTVANAWAYALSREPLVHFRTGLSAGSGLTEQLQWEAIGNHKVIDIPGLNDSQKREQAAKAIEDALKMDGYYTICFLCVCESGRIRLEDIMVIKAVLDAAPAVKAYMVLMNKVSEEELEFFHADEDNMTKLKSPFNLLRIPPETMVFMREDRALKGQPDVVKALPDDVLKALNRTECTHIQERTVQPLDIVDWERKEEMLREAHRIEMQKQLEELKTRFEDRLTQMRLSQAQEREMMQRKAQDDIEKQLKQLGEDAANSKEAEALRARLAAIEANWWYKVSYMDGRDLTPLLHWKHITDAESLLSSARIVLGEAEVRKAQLLSGGSARLCLQHRGMRYHSDYGGDSHVFLEVANFPGSVVTVTWQSESACFPLCRSEA